MNNSKLGKLKAKLSYGAGDMYGGGAFLVFSLLYMNFLTLVEGLPVATATVIIFIGKIWDAVTDPLVGRLSDKTRSRFGRRRLYFLLGILPVFISFVMLFYSFGISSELGKAIYHTLAYMLFGTAFTIVMVPYNAILSDITSDYNERTSFTTVRMVISGASSLLCAVLPSAIIKLVGGNVNGEAQKNGYLIMALILGVFFALAWVIVFLGTKEKSNLETPQKITLRDWFGVFKNKAYCNFLGIFLSFQIAVDLVLAIFVFYVDLVILKYQYYEVLVGILLVFQVIFMLVNGALAQKKGKVFPLFIGLPLWIITSLLFIFVYTDTQLWVLCIFSVLIAVGSSAGNLSTWSMLSDIYDIDEIVTGKRHEGIYSGVTTFLRKFASGVAVLVLGIGLKGLGFDKDTYNMIKSSAIDFDPHQYATEGLVLGIKWMFIAIPIALCLICLVFACFNKVNKKRFDSVIAGIDAYKTDGNLDKLPQEMINNIETITGKNKEELWANGIEQSKDETEASHIDESAQKE
ncbi:MAG: MFS transporter [Clostridia bacterium]|nr:MFS transporter [Clostridia bacterium]